jgi:putative hydrolase of the HAD superfamily
MTKVRCIAFDLDDTLIDTSGLLLPQASSQACAAMKKLGLNCSMEECLRCRAELAKQMSHREIFLEIARKYNTGDIHDLAQAGIKSFYNPQIPFHLPLLSKAMENLQSLSKNYALFLVTSGAPETQRKKIDAAGIKSFFKKCYTLNGFKGEKKRSAFEDIIQSENIQPAELISIGNRIFEEIRQAKQLGAQTCYFKYGEHVGEEPEVAEDHADFTVLSHQELISTCRL